jgi:GTPase SAR1 family protein
MCFVEVIDTAGQGMFIDEIIILISFPSRGIRDSPGPMGSVNINCPLLTHADIDMSSCSEGQGFILVYSIASRSTFERLHIFHQSMLRAKRNSTPIFMLVGNKSDKAREREVSSTEGIALAQTFGCRFFETSAKTAQNVEDLFVGLVRELRKSRNIETTPSLPAKKERFWSKCIIF